MKLSWTVEAREEVKDIYSYLLDEAPALADDWADELENKLKLLAGFPEMGRIVPEFYISFIREIFVGRYRLVYTYQDDAIKIIAIRPMSKPLGKL